MQQHQAQGHKLPTTLLPKFEALCSEQWRKHVELLEHTSRLNCAMVQQKVEALLHHEFVLCNEDHHPNHVRCYCPRFSFAVLRPHGMIQLCFKASMAHPSFGKNKSWTRFLPNSPDGTHGALLKVLLSREALSF